MSPVVLSVFQWRKAGTSPEEFKNYYETIHLPLVLKLAGSAFPQNHTRKYTIRTAHDASSSDKTNSNYRASVYPGTRQEEIDYDVYSERVFEDEKAFKEFETVMFNSISSP